MPQLIVYIDGECPMCRAGADRIKGMDGRNAVRFVDLHDPQWTTRASDRFTHDDLMQEMRVQMPDGSWRVGYFGWAVIFERLPSLAWLGKIMLLPVFYGIGPAVYRWIADHRLQVSKVLGMPPPCDVDGVCRIKA